jgi:hypothetical protein
MVKGLIPRSKRSQELITSFRDQVTCALSLICHDNSISPSHFHVMTSLCNNIVRFLSDSKTCTASPLTATTHATSRHVVFTSKIDEALPIPDTKGVL